MESDTFTTLVHTLQVVAVTGCIFIAGLSSCLSLWVIPLTKLLPPRQGISQFRQTFTWGGQYLLPSSRALGASFLLTSVLTSQLPDAGEAATWRTWAVLFGLLVAIAPYEMVWIFPLNDRVDELAEELRGGRVSEDRAKKEFRMVLDQWQWRNGGRFALPLFVGVAGVVRIGMRGG